MKNILILGGTQFIGRNLVEKLSGIPEVKLTLFNRQQTSSALFPKVTKIKGDRLTANINQIKHQHWDYVIDLSCYYPDALEKTLENLSDSVQKYVLISSCSAYDTTSNMQPLKDESTSLLSCTLEQRVDQTTSSYGNRKAEAERVLSASGIDHVILRPALVYGRYDHTDRFYYWLHQIQTNDPVLLPDGGEKLFSTTYVDDLVNAIITSLELTSSQRVFNVITTPETSIRMIVDETARILGKSPEYINAPPSFLHEHEISQWVDMPLWIDGNHFTYSNDLLRSEMDLKLTSFPDNVADTVVYYQKLNWSIPEYGMLEEIRVSLLELLNDN